MRASNLASNDNKPPGPQGSWIGPRLRSIGRRLFAADDRRALEHSWQITVQHGGLGRRYRDPRFDLLVTCPGCHGAGDRAEPCRRCAGTGRLGPYCHFSPEAR
jgi:hypothetical protein